MRLGVYADLVYRRDGETISTDRAFIKFIANLPPRVSEVVLFGRLAPGPGRSPYALPRSGVRLVPLPHYESVFAVGELVRSLPRARETFDRQLAGLDAVWLFGPHPLALAFARIAGRRGTPLFLGVRQDYPKYIGARLPSRRWLWAVPAAHALEQAFRLLARHAPTVTVGEELARNYRRGPAPVLATGLSLLRASELVPLEEALSRRWDGELRVLSVGRLDPEKNPLLLLDVIAGLRQRDRRWRLTVIGTGPLEPAMERRAAELAVADSVELAGYVPNGPDLWAQYRRSHAFLHVSLTEGSPQVLFEAQAAGLPIVATAVGGVGAALGGGERGLLVGANDARAAIVALERVAADEELRRRLIAAGCENAGRETMDAQLDRLVAFFRAQLAERKARG